MNAMESAYKELLQEHQAALGIWTEAKALYSPDGPKLIAAAIHLEEIESAIETFRTPHFSIAA
jgi:hypothetical protein